MNWIIEDLAAALVQKTVVVPAPLWSTISVEISVGRDAYQKAYLIDTVKFPYMFSHFCNFLVFEFVVLCPFAIAYFTRNPLLGTISCIMLTTGYFGLFHTALDLEEPFGQDKNDLPTTAMLREYAHALEGMLLSTDKGLPRYALFAAEFAPEQHKAEPEPCVSESVARVNQVCETLGLAVFTSWISEDELLCISEDVLQEIFGGDKDCAVYIQRVIWRECGKG